MIDTYTKAVLTVIATALCAIALHMFVGPASAQLEGCGSNMVPCHVEVDNTVSVDGSVDVTSMP